MKTRRLPLVIGHWTLVLSSAVATAAVATADDALRPIAFQNGVNQQSLGTETAEIARTIDALIDELQRNGFPVQSLSGLTELAAQLNALGGTEMTAIATRLRRLGENAQADPRATAAEAYLAQQAIETRLKTLARQISIQQLREETARRLETLITRQLAIQRETRAIATAKPDADRQRLLESDQTGIGEDLTTFFQTGENLLARLRENDAAAAKRTTTSAPAPGATTPAPAPAPTFSERINGAYLTGLSTEATDHLKGKRYPDAYGRQESLVAELRKILQGILSSLPKEQRLASALQQVSALRQQEAARPQTTTPENKQAAADQAQSLANQVAPLSPEAAAALLQAAQETLQKTPGPQTTPPTTPPATPPAASSQPPQPGQQPGKKGKQPEPPDSQPPGPSAAAQSLANAEAALRQALTQAQAANSQNQPGQGQQPGQPQGQPQQGQGQQTAQTGQDGQSPNPNQQGGRQQAGLGDTQNQIAGSGPNSGDPAQVVGALRREEREALNTLQNERYPAEYSAWVQQYWRNLAQDQ